MLNTDLNSSAMRPWVAVPAAELRSLRPIARAAGISLGEILRGLDLSPELVDEPRASAIELADYFRIMERFSLALRDESCGLSARPLMLGATDLVLSNLSGCADLLEVMRTVARTYNILHGGPYNRVDLRSNRLKYVIDDAHFPFAPQADPAHILFRMNCVLVFLHALLTLVAGEDLAGLLRQVQTKSDNDGCGFSAFWGVPIRWRSRHYALEYELEALSLAVGGARSLPSSQAIYRRMVEMAEQRRQEESAPRSVLGAVCAAFGENIFEQSAVARRAGVSVATLRRRLHAEGLPSFRELHDCALRQSARMLLDRRLSPIEVADQLGFSDLRSFNRAFKRWTGRTPAAYARERIDGA